MIYSGQIKRKYIVGRVILIIIIIIIIIIIKVKQSRYRPGGAYRVPGS